jgi:hypothetical protein
MSTEKIDLIEKELKLKEIAEYEIFLRDKAVYETIFLKDKSANEREINDFEYFIRILSQKDNETGVGEAIISALIVFYIYKVKPEFIITESYLGVK